MKTAYRVMQICLVLALCVCLVRATPWSEESSGLPAEGIVDAPPRKPSPEEIVSWPSHVLYVRRSFD
jgi:hypothetical protein